MKKKQLLLLLGACIASVATLKAGSDYTTDSMFGYKGDVKLSASNHAQGTTRFDIKFRNNLDTTLTDEAGKAYIANYGLRLYALPPKVETFQTIDGKTYPSPVYMPVGTNAKIVAPGYSAIFEHIFVECLARNAQFLSNIGATVKGGLVQSTPDLPKGAKVVNLMLPLMKGSYKNYNEDWPLLASTYVQNFAEGRPGEMYFFDLAPTSPLPFSKFRNFLNGANGFPFITLPFEEDYKPYCVSRYQPIDMTDNMLTVPFKNKDGHQSYFVYDGHDVYVALHFHTPCTVDTAGNETWKNIDKQLYREFVQFYPSGLFTKYPAIGDRYARNETGVEFAYSTYANKETVRRVATRYNMSHLSLGSNGDIIDIIEIQDPKSHLFPGDTAEYCTYRNFGVDGTWNPNIEENYRNGRTLTGASTMAADALGVTPYTLPAFRLHYFSNEIVIKCIDQHDASRATAPVHARLRTKDENGRYRNVYMEADGDENGVIKFEDVDPTRQYELTVGGISADANSNDANYYGYAYAYIDFDHITTEAPNPSAAPARQAQAAGNSGDMLFNDILIKATLTKSDIPTGVEDVKEPVADVRGYRGGMEVIAIQNCTIPVYDMTGRLMRTLQVTAGENAFDGFTQGLYIANGQKVVVQ